MKMSKPLRPRIDSILLTCWQMLVLISVVTSFIPTVHAAEQNKSERAAAQEARRKCPLGPYDRCGELVGAFPQNKNKFPPVKRNIGGFDYLIPADFFQVLDPTGYSNQLTAYWIPLAHYLDGREVAGTLYAREAVKYGLMWPNGIRIEIKANRPQSKKKRSTYSSYACEGLITKKDPYPLKMAFDMTMYRDRSFENEKKYGKTINFDACFVSDDPKYTFYPGVPVTYWVHPHNTTVGNTNLPYEEHAEAYFTIRNETIEVRYMFQTVRFPYWREIHRAVLQLIQSWEQ